MVDYSKHEEFKSEFLKLRINGPIKYFEIVYRSDRFSENHVHYLELCENVILFLHKYNVPYINIILPIEDDFIKMITITQIHQSGTSYGNEVGRANIAFVINHLREKNGFNYFKPNCKQGSNGCDLIHEISRNQDYYVNEMKKKNITVELDEIIKNYCNKINIMESKYNELKSEHLSICVIKDNLENENKRYHSEFNKLSDTNEKYYNKINDLENTVKNQLSKNKELEKSLQDLQVMYKKVFDDREKLGVEIIEVSANLVEKDEYYLLQVKFTELENENKKQYERINNVNKLNKRLVNLITIYKYHDLNNVETYDYSSIKEKNRKLNSEFKRIAKLMKLC